MLRWSEAATFVNDFQLLCHVVVKTVEAHQKRRNTWRKSENTGLSKGIRLQEAIHMGADLVLLLLTAAIQRGEIEVGGTFHLCPILLISMEDVVDNDGS